MADGGRAPLAGSCVIVDLSAGIPGAYCTKVLADAGAEVIKIEPREGDYLRRRSASGAPVSIDEGGPLFQYLSGSKASVVVDLEVPEDRIMVEELIRAADAVVWSADGLGGSHVSLDPERIRAVAPQASVVAITPFGLGDWRDVPANQFTLQAMAGGVWSRGSLDRPPVSVGGDHGDWVTGTVAALSLLIARWRSRQTGARRAGRRFDARHLDAHAIPVSGYAPRSDREAALRPP